MVRKKKKKAKLLQEDLVTKHSGVLGLCAFVNAFPYDVPEFVPDILMVLSDHLHDPQPIPVGCITVNYKYPSRFSFFLCVSNPICNAPGPFSIQLLNTLYITLLILNGVWTKMNKLWFSLFDPPLRLHISKQLAF